MREALLAAAQHDTLGGKIFVIAIVGALFGGLGIWVLRSIFKDPGSLLSKVGQFLLAMICFGLVIATVVLETRGS